MVTNIDKTQELTNALEDLLVKEFRIFQSLHALTREERVALSNNDVQLLLSLVERKEATLDELGRLEDSKRMTVQELATLLELATPSGEAYTVSDVIVALEADAAARLANLREGISALIDKLRDLTHGNRALANTSLERADALQSFLLSFYQSPGGYRPQGMPVNKGPSLAWELDQLA